MSEKKKKTIIYTARDKDKSHKLSVYLSEVSYNTIKTLAAKSHRSLADVIREYVEKGLSIESYVAEFETIRKMIREELQIVTSKEIERLIKLQVRSTKASAITMYSSLQLLSEQYADETLFKELLANAHKQATAYIKQKEKSDAEYKAEAEQLMSDMQKITVKPKDYYD